MHTPRTPQLAGAAPLNCFTPLEAAGRCLEPMPAPLAAAWTRGRLVSQPALRAHTLGTTCWLALCQLPHERPSRLGLPHGLGRRGLTRSSAGRGSARPAAAPPVRSTGRENVAVAATSEGHRPALAMRSARRNDYPRRPSRGKRLDGATGATTASGDAASRRIRQNCPRRPAPDAASAGPPTSEGRSRPLCGGRGKPPGLTGGRTHIRMPCAAACGTPLPPFASWGP